MALAIIGDVFPENRRGRATGSLMTGFALASVAGVPFGLYLGTNYGWHVPFFVLAIGGMPALLLAPFALPPLNGHIGKSHTHPLRSIVETFSHANHLNAFALIIALMVGSFTVFPYLSPYFVANVGMTEEQLPWVYIAGGGLTLFAAPIVGRLADRFGKLVVFRRIIPFSVVLLLVITNLPPVPVLIAVAVFGALMVSNVGRMICAMAMVTSSVEQRRRGAFLSANSSVQHIASGLGAYLGGRVVTQSARRQDRQLWHRRLDRRRRDAAQPLARGPRQVAYDESLVKAEAISLAAAAEASVDAGEPMVGSEIGSVVSRASLLRASGRRLPPTPRPAPSRPATLRTRLRAPAHSADWQSIRPAARSPARKASSPTGRTGRRSQ